MNQFCGPAVIHDAVYEIFNVCTVLFQPGLQADEVFFLDVTIQVSRNKSIKIM